jgi:hypothetical protein
MRKNGDVGGGVQGNKKLDVPSLHVVFDDGYCFYDDKNADGGY